MFKSNTNLINIMRLVKSESFQKALADRGAALDHVVELNFHGTSGIWNVWDLYIPEKIRFLELAS
jgi:hypothetical protein